SRQFGHGEEVFCVLFCSAWPVRLRGARMRTHVPTPTPHRAALNLPSPARKAVDGGSQSSFRVPTQSRNSNCGSEIWAYPLQEHIENTYICDGRSGFPDKSRKIPGYQGISPPGRMAVRAGRGAFAAIRCISEA